MGLAAQDLHLSRDPGGGELELGPLVRTVLRGACRIPDTGHLREARRAVTPHPKEGGSKEILESVF